MPTPSPLLILNIDFSFFIIPNALLQLLYIFLLIDTTLVVRNLCLHKHRVSVISEPCIYFSLRSINASHGQSWMNFS